LVFLSQLGVSFPLAGAGLVGKDAPGQQILDDCRRQRIDTRWLRTTSEAPTAFAEVMTVQPGGPRVVLHARGANALWCGQELDFGKTKARLFHLGYLLLLDRLDQSDHQHGTQAAALLAAAQAAGLKTSVDVVSEDSERFAPVVLSALKHVDYCLLDEWEAGRATGFKTRLPDGTVDPVALRHAAGALLQTGVRELVVIHYPEGSFARTRKGEDVWQPALKLPDRDPWGVEGASDAFVAGVLLGLHEGWELQRCLLTGVCVAAAWLTAGPSATGLRSLNACLNLATKHGLRKPLDTGV
jgi:sugar/nucleoside kinase (ribokinase family)